MSKKGGIDLDSILDQALDDFEEIESAENANKVLKKGERQSGNKGDVQAAEMAARSKSKTTASGKVFEEDIC